MRTLGSTTKRKLVRVESYSINVSFPAKEILTEGTIVKLNQDGEIDTYTGAGGTHPLGMLEVGSAKIGDKATVQTQFVAEVVGTASEVVAVGDILTSTGSDKGLTTYKKATEGSFVIAMALTAGGKGENIQVGVFRVFNKL